MDILKIIGKSLEPKVLPGKQKKYIFALFDLRVIQILNKYMYKSNLRRIIFVNFLFVFFSQDFRDFESSYHWNGNRC